MRCGVGHSAEYIPSLEWVYWADIYLHSGLSIINFDVNDHIANGEHVHILSIICHTSVSKQPCAMFPAHISDALVCDTRC